MLQGITLPAPIFAMAQSAFRGSSGKRQSSGPEPSQAASHEEGGLDAGDDVEADLSAADAEVPPLVFSVARARDVILAAVRMTCSCLTSRWIQIKTPCLDFETPEPWLI